MSSQVTVDQLCVFDLYKRLKIYWRADGVMDLHTTRLGGYGTFSTELLTDYHHNSIIKLSIHWWV